MPAVREAVVDGLFYPAAPAALRAQVAGYLGRVDAADGHARAPKLLIVPHADHSFANPSSAGYNVQAANEAWTTTLAFLERHLKLNTPTR